MSELVGFIAHVLSFSPGLGAASFTIYTRTKEHFRDHNWLTRNSIIDVSVIGGISGAMSGALISFGSARALQSFEEREVPLTLNFQHLNS